MNFKIMLVDADKVFIQRIQKILEANFEVTTANTAVEALVSIREHGPYAVIVSNFNLAHIDGVQLLSMVKELAPDTKGILLTEIMDLDMLVGTVNNAKVTGVLVKPVSLEQLIYQINKGVQSYNQELRKMEIVKTQFRNMQDGLLENEAKMVHYAETLEINIINTFLMLLYTHDVELVNHCSRVAALAYLIAQELNVDEASAKQIKTAALVHDMGKFCIEKELRKKQKLSKRLEQEIMQSHVNSGCRILKALCFAWPLVTIVEQHHETLDGGGYPFGLKGEEITFEARIIAVANTVDNINVKCGSIEGAITTIVNFRGVKFDPIIVDACVSLYRQNRMRLHEILNLVSEDR